ncbi:MAG: rhodanese-like domain-containing protein [Syntrophomonadaceae bacterium]|nr:rhodanese-like domain-containing protein [Syntrophomonadaceae bacterium]
MKKKYSTGIIILLISILLLPGCGGPKPSEDKAKGNEVTSTQYISCEEVKYAVTGMQSDYVLLDVRKIADYDEAHIITAVSADVDAAVSNDDDATATANLQAALKQATGSKTGADRKIVLLCYSGAKYAENATRLLTDIGIDAARIFTLEGGYKGWTVEDAYGEYQYLLDAVALAEKMNKPNTFTFNLFPEPRKGDYYFTPAEVKDLIEAEASGDKSEKISDYYMIDARFQSEYDAGHIVTAIPAASFAAADGAVFVPRSEVIEHLNAAFKKYPYKEGQKFILVCRGGKGGAQLIDDVLREEFDIDNDLIYTLKYGYKAFPESWSKQGDEYMQYVVKGSEPGSVTTK